MRDRKVDSTLAVQGGEPINDQPWPTWPMLWDRESAMARMSSVVQSEVWTVRAAPKASVTCDAEQAWADRCGTRYALCVSSGSAAIELALRGLGIGFGHRVIVPALGWYATAAAVQRVGARCDFVDIDPNTSCIDPSAARQAIVPATRAIVAVHLHCSVADLDRLRMITSSASIPLIEDAAQAHGARYGGKSVGAIGRVGCFSFNQEKLLPVGEGGAVVTDDDDLYQRLFALRTDGYRSLADGSLAPHRGVSGNNLCMSELQGALLLSQLEGFADQHARRQQHARALIERLESIEDIEVLKTAPHTDERGYYEFAVRVAPRRLKRWPLSAFARALTEEVGAPVHPTDAPVTESGQYVLAAEDRSPPADCARSLHAQLLVFHHRLLLSERVIDVFPRALERVIKASESVAATWVGDTALQSEDGVSGRYRIGGECDSPVDTAVLTAVRDRKPLPFRRFLTSVYEPAFPLLVVAPSFDGLELDLQARFGGRGHHRVSCRTKRWSDVEAEAMIAADNAAVLIIERPNRSVGSEQDADAAPRSRILDLQRRFPTLPMVVIVGANDYMVRHALAGWQCFHVDQVTRGATIPHGTEASLLERRRTKILDFFGQLDAASEAGDHIEVLSELFKVFGATDDPVPVELRSGLTARRLTVVQTLFERIVTRQLPRQWYELVARDGAPMTTPARVEARISVALFEILQAEPQRAQQIRLARWLSGLVAQSYELLARATSTLERIDLSNRNLTQTASLEFANLRGATLDGADLYHANLAEADMRGCRARAADLSRAHLKRADLRGADLSNADLSYACLEQADLRGAILTGANLHRANCEDALGLASSRAGSSE